MDHLDGALAAETADRFEHHLSLCPGCETSLQQIKETASILGRLHGIS